MNFQNSKYLKFDRHWSQFACLYKTLREYHNLLPRYGPKQQYLIWRPAKFFMVKLFTLEPVNHYTIRYDREFKVDSKAEYSALSSTRI